MGVSIRQSSLQMVIFNMTINSHGRTKLPGINGWLDMVENGSPCRLQIQPTPNHRQPQQPEMRQSL
jgi:hypothetical protein